MAALKGAYFGGGSLGADFGQLLPPRRASTPGSRCVEAASGRKRYDAVQGLQRPFAGHVWQGS